MKKTILVILLLAAVTGMEGKIKFGVRAGVNTTNVSASGYKGLNRQGFYIGPTLKIGLPGGFDIDGSLLYNRQKADADIYVDAAGEPDSKWPLMKRESVSVPLNLRKGFGFGDKAGIFIFAGPQFSWHLGKNASGEYTYKFKDRDLAVNVGIGCMLLNHIEVKASYLIPCQKSGELYNATKGESYGDIKLKGWSIGAAIYF